MFALVDAHNFYVSCERLFQPHLKRRPVAVLSNNDACVVARSNEVKALGCPMGAPYFKVKALFKQHHVKVFSSNYALYGDISARLMAILTQFNSHCEVYSIDEAFLFFQESHDFHTLGHTLRQRILQWLGLPVGIGFGPTKALAKVANRLTKAYPQRYNGCCVLTESTCDDALALLPVDELWGIGRRHAKKLVSLGYTSALDFKYAPTNIIKNFFKKPGLMLQQELWGTPCLSLTYNENKRKSICSSNSFAQPLSEKAAIAATLFKQIQKAYQKCRVRNIRASHMMIFIHTSYYVRQRVFCRALTSLDRDAFTLLSLGDVMLQLLDRCFEDHVMYHKSGVLLWGLQDCSAYQASLFEEHAISSFHSHTLDRALDTLNKRFGSATVQRASQRAFTHTCHLKSAHLSSRYTSCWNELLHVSA